MLRRYELADENKFWEIWTEAQVVYFRFGKSGSQGQTKLKKVASPEAAVSEESRLVAEKEKQGYTLVSSNAAGKAKKAKANPELEKAILADPDSPDGYLVYGDWLTEQGDPLGEYIAVQAALTKKPTDKALTKKADELLKANEEAWFGGLAGLKSDGELEATWKNGFLHTVAMGGDEYGESDGVEAVTALCKLSTSRFLQDLELRCFEDDDGQPSYSKCIAAMVKLGLPRTLKRLAFDVKGYQISWTSLGDLSKLYPLIEGLEELRLCVGSMKLGAMNLPNLKRLEVETCGFNKDNVKSVLGASWPKLEKLVIFLGPDEYGCNCKIKDVLPLLEGKNLPKVTHFALCNSEFQDDIAKAIAGAKITKQLKILDLSKGTMSDAGAQALLDGAKQLAHLEKLDLSENYISDDMAKKLKATFGKALDVSEQGEGEDEDDRYVQVAE